MSINFERKYAYAEIYDILNWLGDDYKKKVPRNMLRLFKNERKFGYRPEIDYTKPLDSQVRQETKNIMAFLETRCFLDDKAKIKTIEDTVKQRHIEKKARERAARAQSRATRSTPLNAAIDRAINELNKPQ